MGKIVCSTNGLPRVTDAGFLPSRTLIKFSCCSMRRSRSGIAARRRVDQLLRLANVHHRGGAALRPDLDQTQGLLAGASVRREISSSASSSSNWK